MPLAPEPSGAQPGDDQDPPGRVAQLNYIDGSVTFQPGGENDWLDAVLNRPLVTGDNLWADQNSRAELHIGSTALRLGPMTGITLLEVSDHATQIRLVQGSLIVKVRHVDSDDAYEIDTPNIAFVVMQPGDYRINVDSEGARTDVIVWRGLGEATGGGSSYTVAADQHATFTGT
ncbi:MAG: FecR domain-containing protein, partial [Candidatus Sulfotelmatobacter sp.]